jgi:histidinol phosphatase-like PHP family hydrolase
VTGKCEYNSIAKDANNNPVNNVTHDCYNKYVKLLEANGKHYCFCHFKTTVKKIEYDKKLKEKMEKKQVLILEKQKAKEEQAKLNKEQKSKKLVKKVQNENVIISSSSQNPESCQIDQTKCVQILKVGKNKGKQCFCKIYKDGVCLRHFNLNSKL